VCPNKRGFSSSATQRLANVAATKEKKREEESNGDDR